MRKAFTLIEMLISITILSIMMVFLYKSYSSLNSSNKFFKSELENVKDVNMKKKMLFLDFTLAKEGKTKILNQSIKEDVVFTQSSNSVHRRFNPYIAYVVKEGKLYRLESLKEFVNYPLSFETSFVSDYLGEVNSFRVYKSKADREAYLLHVDFKDEDDILLKVNVL